MDLQRGIRYGLGVGSPDLVGLIHGTGLFIGIEVKTPKGRLSEDQKCWIRRVSAIGGRVTVCRTVDEAVNFILDCARAKPAD